MLTFSGKFKRWSICPKILILVRSIWKNLNAVLQEYHCNCLKVVKGRWRLFAGVKIGAHQWTGSHTRLPHGVVNLNSQEGSLSSLSDSPVAPSLRGCTSSHAYNYSIKGTRRDCACFGRSKCLPSPWYKISNDRRTWSFLHWTSMIFQATLLSYSQNSHRYITFIERSEGSLNLHRRSCAWVKPTHALKLPTFPALALKSSAGSTRGQRWWLSCTHMTVRATIPSENEWSSAGLDVLSCAFWMKPWKACSLPEGWDTWEVVTSGYAFKLADGSWLSKRRSTMVASGSLFQAGHSTLRKQLSSWSSRWGRHSQNGWTCEYFASA